MCLRFYRTTFIERNAVILNIGIRIILRLKQNVDGRLSRSIVIRRTRDNAFEQTIILLRTSKTYFVNALTSYHYIIISSYLTFISVSNGNICYNYLNVTRNCFEEISWTEICSPKILR